MEARADGSKAIAVLNDSSRGVAGDVLEALEAYSVIPAVWSERKQFVDILRN